MDNTRIARFRITPEFVVSICQGLTDGESRLFKVTRNALPGDANVIDMDIDHGCLVVVLNSDSFDSVSEGMVVPELEPVEMCAIYYPDRNA